MTTGDFNHFAELRIAFLAAADVTRIDAVLGERARAGFVLPEQLVTVEMKIPD